MGLFSEFHSKGVFEKSLHATFICLIPKVAVAKDINKCKPISLVGSVYKILAKVLASRLRRGVDEVVSPGQHAFVHGRHIMDASLIANECNDYYRRTNLSGILCKLEIEKAYDLVSWEFVMAILEKMGFPSKWRNWIFFYIPTVRFSFFLKFEWALPR